MIRDVDVDPKSLAPCNITNVQDIQQDLVVRCISLSPERYIMTHLCELQLQLLDDFGEVRMFHFGQPPANILMYFQGSILFQLRMRYLKNLIYTQIGSILGYEAKKYCILL